VAEVPPSKTTAAKAAKPVAVPAKPAVSAVAAPKAAAAKPVATKAAPAKPVPAPAPKPAPVAQAVAATPTIAPTAADTVIPTQSAAPSLAAAPQKGPTMNDTVNKFQETAHAATERATAMFGDLNGRAKDAVAKGTKAIEELVEFSKGNLEAVAASGRVAAKGAEEIAKYSAEYGRSSIEKANATAKQFAAVKSPTEFFQLQGDVAKQTLDALVSEGSKFTENYLKLLGEIVQPISNRVAVAAEKVKTNVTI